jgi:LysM repeat protein
MFKRLFLYLSLLSFCFNVYAADLALKADAPKEYVIQSGDTLWSIASRYLVHPWQWAALYSHNADLSHNPNKLYVGDILRFKNLRDHAKLYRVGKSTLKLSPAMREESLDKPIPAIPYAELQPFLRGMRILTPRNVANSPYVIAIEGSKTAGMAGMEIYAQNLNAPAERDYFLYRKGQLLVDPVSKLVLGYEGQYVGNARLLRYKPHHPAVLLMSSSQEEVLPGDYLSSIPPLSQMDDLMIREPNTHIEGQIIANLSEETRMSQNQVVVINRGRYQSLRNGDVLAIYRKGELVRDPTKPEHASYHKKDLIQLPNRRIGELIIFKLFDNASLGLIMNSTEESSLLDHVTNP